MIPVKDGFKCRACPFITTSEKIANTYWRSAAYDLFGRCYTKVRVQSWVSRKYARYWAVGSTGYEPAINIDARDEVGNTRSLSILKRILRTGAKRPRESNEQRMRAGQAQRGADYDNEFVKDMRWVEFTRGNDCAAIAAATRWAKSKAIDRSAEEAQGQDAEQTVQLMMLCESVKREVRRCGPRIYAVPKPIRQRLHGIEEGKSNRIPFKMSDILTRYANTALRCRRLRSLGYVMVPTRVSFGH